MKSNLLTCLRKKRDRWIPVRLKEEILMKRNLEMKQVSARLTSGNHLFITGKVRKKDETVQLEQYLIIVCCDIENSKGNILFHIEDSHIKNMKLNPCDTFFLAIYQINRFLEMDDINYIVIYCQYASQPD